MIEVFLSLLTASFCLSVCFGFVLSLYAAISGGLCWSEDRMQVFGTLAFFFDSGCTANLYIQSMIKKCLVAEIHLHQSLLYSVQHPSS